MNWPQLLAFCRLARWGNLLFICLALLLIRYCLINPLYHNPFVYQTNSLSEWQFVLLVISVATIAAGGYIINDYFDVATDQVNKPDRVIIGKEISAAQAMRVYQICTGFGIVLGIYLGGVMGELRLGFLHILVAALLWCYAVFFKKTSFWGNLLIASLVAFSIFIIIPFENQLWETLVFQLKASLRQGLSILTASSLNSQNIVVPENKALHQLILQYVLGYTLFAFLFTLIREIVKDAEDVKGDRRAGYQTLPIVWGLPVTKIIAFVPTIFCIHLVVRYLTNQLILQQYGTILFISLFVLVPTTYLAFRLWKAREKRHFSHLSKVLKGIMLMGVLYLVYFRTTIRLNIEITNTLPSDYEILDIQLNDIDAAMQEKTDSNQIKASFALDSLSIAHPSKRVTITQDSTRAATQIFIQLDSLK